MFEISTDTSLLRVNICGLIQPRSPPANQSWKNSALPAARAGGRGSAGAQGVGAGGASLRPENSAFRPLGRLREPGDFAHFSGGEKGLRLFFFFFFQFSVPSINKPPELARFWACPRGSAGGLGEGRRLCSIPNESSNPFRRPHSRSGGVSGSEGTRSSCAVGGPARRTPQVQPRGTPRSRQGPPQRGGARRLPRGPGPRLQPSPARPVPGSGSFINQRLGERAAL